MTEKWRPSPSVLNGRRVRRENFLTRSPHASYALGDFIEAYSKQPVMDSIWEWNKSAVEDIPHIS